jgi:hypothetical protein
VTEQDAAEEEDVLDAAVASVAPVPDQGVAEEEDAAVVKEEAGVHVI